MVEGLFFCVAFSRAAQVAYPQAPQLIPTDSIATDADNKTGITCGNILCIAQEESQPVLRAIIRHRAGEFFYLGIGEHGRRISSCPFAFGAVRAASAMSPATAVTAVFSTVMREYGKLPGDKAAGRREVCEKEIDCLSGERAGFTAGS